jgi:hypothetical protein
MRCGGTSRADCDADCDNASDAFLCGSSSDCVVSECVLPSLDCALIGGAAGWAACSLVFFLLRRLDSRSSWKAAFVCLRAPLMLFETLLWPFPPLSDELIKGIEMLLEISAAAPSRADVLMSSCSFLGIAATNTVRVRYNDK